MRVSSSAWTDQRVTPIRTARCVDSAASRSEQVRDRPCRCGWQSLRLGWLERGHLSGDAGSFLRARQPGGRRGGCRLSRRVQRRVLRLQGGDLMCRASVSSTAGAAAAATVALRFNRRRGHRDLRHGDVDCLFMLLRDTATAAVATAGASTSTCGATASASTASSCCSAALPAATAAAATAGAATSGGRGDRCLDGVCLAARRRLHQPRPPSRHGRGAFLRGDLDDGLGLFGCHDAGRYGRRCRLRRASRRPSRRPQPSAVGPPPNCYRFSPGSKATAEDQEGDKAQERGGQDRDGQPAAPA